VDHCFPLSWIITWILTLVTDQTPLEEHELLSILEHLSSMPFLVVSVTLCCSISSIYVVLCGPLLSSFMNYHMNFNISYRPDATSGAWIAFHSRALEFNAIFSGVCNSVFSISSIYVVLCGPLLSSFMNYHMNFNISYRPDATSGAWIAFHSGALEFNAIFSGVCDSVLFNL
jgi:hypothetical protein